MHVVKTSDAFLPKDLGLTSLPQLVYFRNGEPLLYTGNGCVAYNSVSTTLRSQGLSCVTSFS